MTFRQALVQRSKCADHFDLSLHRSHTHIRQLQVNTFVSQLSLEQNVNKLPDDLSLVCLTLVLVEYLKELLVLFGEHQFDYIEWFRSKDLDRAHSVI
jgi:hypothetical protein